MSISFIETKDPKDFPEHKELFSLIENFMGYLPHAFLLMAENPNLLNAFSGLSNEIFSSDEIDNQTAYCSCFKPKLWMQILSITYFSWCRKGRSISRKNPFYS